MRPAIGELLMLTAAHIRGAIAADEAAMNNWHVFIISLLIKIVIIYSFLITFGNKWIIIKGSLGDVFVKKFAFLELLRRIFL